MEQLYEKYLNIQLFTTKYRKYELIDESFETYENFKNKMQIFEYVLHKFVNPKFPDKVIDLYLFKHDSKYISLTAYFKKILDRYNTEQTIIMITKEELNVYRKKSVKQYKNLVIKNYLHKHFIIEMNRGPLCSVHTVLSMEETKAVCYDIMSHGHKLAAIFESDPQNIWIGGEINDIIKIDTYSEITGKSTHYRIVTPASGKILQSPAIIKKETLEKPLESKLESVKENNDSDVGEVEEEDYDDDYIEDTGCEADE
jgi:DNA-directed RNA polymerase subunit H (RpoH/RPB5)